jgi:predicted amino acid-binding ACT domain protein
MALKVTKVEVWAGELSDQVGALSRVLAAVAGGGGNVQCVIARRDPSRPGRGEVFVTPITADRAGDAARGAGLSPAQNLATLRVEGADAAGLGARITEALAAAGINLRGVTAAVVGNRFVTYVGLDSAGDADAAVAALRGVKAPAGRGGASGGGKRSAGKSRSGSGGRRASGGAKRASGGRGKKRSAAKRRR